MCVYENVLYKHYWNSISMTAECMNFKGRSNYAQVSQWRVNIYIYIYIYEYDYGLMVDWKKFESGYNNENVKENLMCIWKFLSLV